MTRGGGTVARAGGLKRRGERLSGRDASLHCAIGRDVEDAATANAEKPAESTSRASGPAWRPGRNCDNADETETSGCVWGQSPNGPFHRRGGGMVR